MKRISWGWNHGQLHELAERAANVAAHEGQIEEEERRQLLAWINAASDALRLQHLGHHDRELLEFVQGERDKLRAGASRVRDLLSAWQDLGKAHAYGCGTSRPCDACEINDTLAFLVGGGNEAAAGGADVVAPEQMIAIRGHIARCPLGYHEGEVITTMSTTTADVIAWLAELRRLAGST